MRAFHDNLQKKKNSQGIEIIVAKADIPKDTVVFEFKGNIFKRSKLPNNNWQDYLQIDKDLFLGMSGDLDDIIRHSCNPSCWIKIVGRRALLISRHFIKAGSEITFDYSITSTQEPSEWSMQCNCGVYTCRKIISGYRHLNENIRKHYEAANIVPQYVKEVK